MFKFKTWEEEQKIADYDRLAEDFKNLAAELENTKASLNNCERSRQDWVDHAGNLQKENRELYAEVLIWRNNDETRQKMSIQLVK